ncbi:hypothetical protein T281_11175 [Rhodomicrobium udaipurense JA643]|uniref:DUF4760 domain-containing protein n=1 Tax=Rhodomicrobium udaipurense TaxID=1202716 RepID=A0A8I1GI25_9HYPH|nr:hypothetical protein [Rhodomicrobium udaipurense]KAI94381.1 hypothetical protein T281_11175 [Rhodomicrobium udaipurense JA643]MBJ7544576.1 hypothetical protein [Rhodomicrobium udaipurense]
MTRRRQNRILRIVVAVLVGFIALSLLSKINDDNPRLSNLYEFIKDSSLLIATIAVAYLANIYQRRQNFLDSLREQWREIVKTKGALLYYCKTSEPDAGQYWKAFTQLSECIDNMRIVYANVGETNELIGAYPFEPLHDMRRAFEKLDPAASTAEDRALVWEKIEQAFNAIREKFLDEFDIEAPSKPILKRGTGRTKVKGARV